MKSGKTSIAMVKAGGLILQVIGWILFLPSLFFWVFCIFQQDPSMKIAQNVFLLGALFGGSLLLMGRQRTELVQRYYQYTALLAADPSKSLVLLAGAVGRPMERVKKDVMKMIASGFFPGAGIDQQRMCLVFPNEVACVSARESHNAAATPAQGKKEITYLTVRCNGCGACNKVEEGKVGECEYCGSQISGRA